MAVMRRRVLLVVAICAAVIAALAAIFIVPEADLSIDRVPTVKTAEAPGRSDTGMP
jgi:hypothetical protein